jgi:hypothetical protein
MDITYGQIVDALGGKCEWWKLNAIRSHLAIHPREGRVSDAIRAVDELLFGRTGSSACP